MAHPHPHPQPMTLPSLSPASASSSTLIVTPLPSSSSSSSQPKKRLSLGLTISTSPQTPVQAKMSARGFVEPHHSHLPRRTRAKTTPRERVRVQGKVEVDVKEKEEENSVSPAPLTRTNSGIEDPHRAFLSTPPVPVLSPGPPLLSRSRPSFPPRSLFPGLHDASDDDETSPTHLLSLKLPPSPSPEFSLGLGLGSGLGLGTSTTPPRPTHAALTSAALSLGLGFNLGSPTPATPGSAPVHTPMNRGPLHANLPRRTARAHARVRAGTAPSHQNQQTTRAQARARSAADVRADGQLDERRGAGAGSSEETQDGTGGGEAEGAEPEEPATPTPRPAQGGGGRGGGGSARLMIGQRERRHVRRVNVLDRAGKAHISSGRVNIHGEAGVSIDVEVEEKAKTKTREEMLEERACIQPVGHGTGVEVGFLSSYGAEELEVGEEGEGGFWGLPPHLDGLEHAVGTSTTDNDNDPKDNEMEKLRWDRMRKVVLRVVMNDDDDEDNDGGLDRDRDREGGLERRDGGDARIGNTTTTTATTSDAGSTVDEDSSVGVAPTNGAPAITESSDHPFSDPSPSNPDPERVLQPPPELGLELELHLPSDLTAYKEGQTALTPEQMADAFAFIGRHLGYPSLPPQASSSGRSEGSSAGTESDLPAVSASRSSSTDTNKRNKKKIRILAPRARPEDAMSLAVGYLAYTSPPLSAASTAAKSEHEAEAEDPYTPAHFLWMHLMDDGARADDVDTRGTETSREGDDGADANVEVYVDVDADVDADGVDGLLPRLDQGIRDEWRGVLSYDGLMKVHSALTLAGSDASGPSIEA